MSEANLIEAYSLTFEHYKGKVSPQLSTHGRNLPVDERPLTLLEGRQTLRDMVDKLFQVLYACDRRGRRLKNNPLPGKWSYTTHLHNWDVTSLLITKNTAQFRMIFLAEYNDSAPRDYQPSYFKPGNAATSTIMNLCESDDRFVMDTSYHVYDPWSPSKQHKLIDLIQGFRWTPPAWTRRPSIAKFRHA